MSKIGKIFFILIIVLMLIALIYPAGNQELSHNEIVKINQNKLNKLLNIENDIFNYQTKCDLSYETATKYLKNKDMSNALNNFNIAENSCRQASLNINKITFNINDSNYNQILKDTKTKYVTAYSLKAGASLRFIAYIQNNNIKDLYEGENSLKLYQNQINEANLNIEKIRKSLNEKNKK